MRNRHIKILMMWFFHIVNVKKAGFESFCVRAITSSFTFKILKIIFPFFRNCGWELKSHNEACACPGSPLQTWKCEAKFTSGWLTFTYQAHSQSICCSSCCWGCCCYWWSQQEGCKCWSSNTHAIQAQVMKLVIPKKT